MRFAELVFHVLAHVRGSAHLAPSAYDAKWIAFVERHAGRRDTLAEDCDVLGRAATTHDALAELQLVAWLFDDASRAALCAERSLTELSPSDVDDVHALTVLTRPHVNAAAEVLRAAAELEEEVYASLPPPDREPTCYARVRSIAPWIERYRIEEVRPLRVRGRVRRDLIFVGVPCRELGPSADHVAFQAAHEATVAEVRRACRTTVTHDALEHAALVLLAERAVEGGLGDAHARWLRTFANIPELSRARLSDEWREAIDRVQSSAARP